MHFALVKITNKQSRIYSPLNSKSLGVLNYGSNYSLKTHDAFSCRKIQRIRNLELNFNRNLLSFASTFHECILAKYIYTLLRGNLNKPAIFWHSHNDQLSVIFNDFQNRNWNSRQLSASDRLIATPEPSPTKSDDDEDWATRIPATATRARAGVYWSREQGWGREERSLAALEMVKSRLRGKPRYVIRVRCCCYSSQDASRKILWWRCIARPLGSARN